MRFEFAVGGIVYRKDPSTSSSKDGQAGQANVQVLVAQHSQHHGWVFPKGLIGDNPSASAGQEKETKEEAAVREVKEETGIEAEIEKELTPVTYWYVWEKDKIKKTVYYFVMKFVSGDTKDHDHEMEKVEWIPSEKVENRLTYPSDKKVWREAKELINDII